MSFRDSVKSVESRRQSEYVAPGRYLFRINDFKEGTTRKNDDFVVAELQVVDSSDLDRHPRGSERSYWQKTSADTAARNIRTFIAKALNCPDDALTAEMIDKAFEKKEDTGRSPLSGLLIACNAREITTRAGRPYTLCDWIAVDQDVESLADI